jgi:anti-sigma regulatory factor (Ser/Thr protein kinase)
MELARHAHDARFELHFAPNVSLVPAVRHFVTDFYGKVVNDADITDRLAIAAHELLENAVRYSIDAQTTIGIRVGREGENLLVTIRTSNRASPEQIELARKAFEEVVSAPDAAVVYAAQVRRAATRTAGSGLGLGRVRAEMGLVLSYEIRDDNVTVVARGTFPMKVEQR